MSEPTPIEPSRLLEFIEVPGLTVVLVSVHLAHSFNQALCKRLSEEHGDEMAFRTVDLAELLASGGSALPSFVDLAAGFAAMSRLASGPNAAAFIQNTGFSLCAERLCGLRTRSCGSRTQRCSSRSRGCESRRTGGTSWRAGALDRVLL